MDLTWLHKKSLNNIQRWNCAATRTPLWERPRLSGGVPYLPHGVLFSWVVSRFEAASLSAHSIRVRCRRHCRGHVLGGNGCKRRVRYDHVSLEIETSPPQNSWKLSA